MIALNVLFLLVGIGLICMWIVALVIPSAAPWFLWLVFAAGLLLILAAAAILTVEVKQKREMREQEEEREKELEDLRHHEHHPPL